MMHKGKTNYKLLGAYVAKIIANSIIDFSSKNSLSLNIFSTIGDSTVKKNKTKKIAEAHLLKKLFAEENFSSPPP